jgi:hypothetical protein
MVADALVSSDAEIARLRSTAEDAASGSSHEIVDLARALVAVPSAYPPFTSEIRHRLQEGSRPNLVRRRWPTAHRCPVLAPGYCEVTRHRRNPLILRAERTGLEPVPPRHDRPYHISCDAGLAWRVTPE